MHVLHVLIFFNLEEMRRANERDKVMQTKKGGDLGNNKHLFYVLLAMDGKKALMQYAACTLLRHMHVKYGI